MALGIGSLTAWFGDAFKFAAFEKVFDFFGDKVKGETTDRAISGILKHGSRWGGLDRSDEQLLAALYGALYQHYENEYDDLRDALDVLWQDLLSLDKGRGKWSKRWRGTFVGMSIKDDADRSTGIRRLKYKTPILNKKTGQPVLGPDDKVLYNEEYEDGRAPLGLSKEDPRLRHLYLIAKMADEEQKNEVGVLRLANSPRLPNTVNHLLVTYLQDDPYFKLMGELWAKVLPWAEGRNPLVQAQAFAWLNAEDRERINALGLSEADKTALRAEMVRTNKSLFQDDLRKVKEEPLWRGMLRFWWLWLLPVAIIAGIMLLPAR